MRRGVLRLACVVAATCLLAQAGGAFAQDRGHEDPARKLRDTSRVLVIAHRGCVGDAPEVSVAAIHACAGKGIDGVEVDVRRTRDGALVSIHDATLERMTNGTGKVADHTLEELRKLRLRRGNGGPNVVVTDEHVPTLEEMLLAAKQHGFVVHLDIKTASHEEVAAVLRKLGMEGHATAWLTGRADDPHQPDPSVRDAMAIVVRIQDCPEGSPANCRPNGMQDLMGFAKYDVAGYFLWYKSTPEDYAAFNAARRPTGTRLTTETLWQIDSLPQPERHAEYRRLLDAGATLFLTDRPVELVNYLDQTLENRR